MQQVPQFKQGKEQRKEKGTWIASKARAAAEAGTDAGIWSASGGGEHEQEIDKELVKVRPASVPVIEPPCQVLLTSPFCLSNKSLNI